MSKGNAMLKKVIIYVFLGCLALGLLSGLIPNIWQPAAWLLAWTSWLGTVAAIVAGTKFLWFGSEAAKEYVLKKRGEN